MKTILITGINGFLGSNLAKALTSEYNIVGLEYSLEDLYRIKDENFIVYSVKNGIPDQLFTENKIDIIIHTATFYGRNNEDVLTMAKTNTYLPLELLEKAIKNKCQLFINTDTVINRFVNVYALTKSHFQEWLYMRCNEIKIINMQLEHFYGPGASSTNFITAMINRLKQNEPSIELTLGEQQRDFIYIDDVVAAFHKILERSADIKENYSSFQVCSGELMSIKNIVEELKILTTSSTILNFGAQPYRENELMKSSSDNSELRKLGWSPTYSIKDGLINTVNV